MELNTRRDFEALVHKLLDPLLPLYSPGGARLQIGETGATYRRDTMQMEGFSRILWALAPLLQGGGEAPELERIYRKGLASGTDPAHPEYWGTPGDYDQLFVEMAAIACAILEVPDRFWQPLSDREKKNLAAWLNTINQHKLPLCNWLGFRILVNLALRSVDMPRDEQRMELDLQAMESWYIGEGWYSDGAPQEKPQRDYYVPWGIQYYCLLYSVFAADTDPERAARLRQRALVFGREFRHWFDENGAAVPYGRSLSYRFAQCAFYSLCVWAGLEPLPLEVMKGIIVRNLQWWMEKPILDRDGVLSIGYCYPQMFMAERYNAPGSPYWCLKSFILLGLPEDHPFWKAKAAPLGEKPGLTAMHSAHFLVQRTPDGQVNLYAPAEVEKNEHGQFAEKYGKFVYSTRFGFSASRSYAQLEQAAPDSMLAFVISGQVFVRRHSENFSVQEDRMISIWSPFQGIRVTTELIATETGHIRRHRVQSDIPCTAYDCGFAVPVFCEDFASEVTDRTARAWGKGLFCSVEGSEQGKAQLVHAWSNTSLYFTNTVIPAVRYEIAAGESRLITHVEGGCLQNSATHA